MSIGFKLYQNGLAILILARGWTPDQLFIDYPLKEELDKIADKFATVDKPAQEAQTQLQRLQTVELPYAVSAKHPTSRYSLVRLMPRTGRKHQLRRHMAHIFHPIVGDTKHGDGRHNRLFREQYDCQRLMLCNLSLTIQHPQLQSPLRIQTELDAQWQQLFAQFGWC